VIIAIDGPVAAGKTTLSKILADRLDFSLLDTGAIYRAVALASRQQGTDWSDEPAVAAVASRLEIEFRWIAGTNHVLLAGEDVSEAIRTPEMSQGASLVSALPDVRAALLNLQRQLGEQGNVIAEGRDIGTVVCPEADVKIFVTAGAEARAMRRHRELLERGEGSIYARVLQDLEERDARDSGRAAAPLKAAPDAVVIDTTDMDIDAAFKAAMAAIAATLRS